MNQSLKDGWVDFKKDLTWNNIKIVISAVIPMLIGAWLFVQWINLLNPIMDHYTSNAATPVSLEHAIISLCLVMGVIFPIWPLFLWSSYGGMYLGRITKFYIDDKTRRLVWDDKEYFVRDMPQDIREKIALLLSPYKSKIQLQKEKKLANKTSRGSTK